MDDPISRHEPLHHTRLTFGDVEIHEFGAAIGHNPSVSQGVPITLSNEALHFERVPLESYEQARGPRRTTRQLVISKNLRMEILIREGYTIEEIEQATKECFRKRTDRKKSNSNKNWDGVTEKLEKTKRKFSKMVRRLSPPKDELKRALDGAGESRFSGGASSPLRRTASVDCRLDQCAAAADLNDDALHIPVRRESFIPSSATEKLKRRSPESSPTKPQRRASNFVTAECDPFGEEDELLASSTECTNCHDDESPMQPLSLATAPSSPPRVSEVPSLGCSDSFELAKASFEPRLQKQTSESSFSNTPVPCAMANRNRRNTFDNIVGLPFTDDDDSIYGDKPLTFSPNLMGRPEPNLRRNVSADSALSPRMPERRKSVACSKPKETIKVSLDDDKKDDDAEEKVELDVPRPRRRLSLFGNKIAEGNSDSNLATASPVVSPGRGKERRGSFLSAIMPSSPSKSRWIHDVETEKVVSQAVTGKSKRRDSFISSLVPRRVSMGKNQSALAPDIAPSFPTSRARRRSSFFGGSNESPSAFVGSSMMRPSFQRSASVDSGIGIKNPFRRSRILDEDRVALEYEPMYMPGDSDDFTSEEMMAVDKPAIITQRKWAAALRFDDMACSRVPSPLTYDSPAVKLPLPDDDPSDFISLSSSSDDDDTDGAADDGDSLSSAMLDLVPISMLRSPQSPSKRLDSSATSENGPQSAVGLVTAKLNTAPVSILRPSRYSAMFHSGVVDAPKARRRSSFFGSNHGLKGAMSSNLVIRKPQLSASAIGNALPRASSDSAPLPVPRRGSVATGRKPTRCHSLEPPHSAQRNHARLARKASTDILRMPARRVSVVASCEKGSESSAEEALTHSDDEGRTTTRTGINQSHATSGVDALRSVNNGQRTQRRASFFGLGGSSKQGAIFESDSSFASFDGSNESYQPPISQRKAGRRGSFLGFGPVSRSSSQGSQSSFASYDSGSEATPAKATHRGSFLGIGFNARRSRSDHSNASFATNDDVGSTIAQGIVRGMSDQSQSSFASYDDGAHFVASSVTKGITAEHEKDQQITGEIYAPRQLSLNAILTGKMPFSTKSNSEKLSAIAKPRRRSSFFGSGKIPAKLSFAKECSSSLASVDAADWSSDFEPCFPADSTTRSKGHFFGMVRAPAPVARTTSSDSFASFDGSSLALQPREMDHKSKDYSKLGDSYSTVAISETPSS
ncbi:hypothetical protein MPSEU_000181600 [Mayamaea pseudoterrestris]|nr:hypothetical protein MPSEU_000181600 [Mayamaea pseudoterrestris]